MLQAKRYIFSAEGAFTSYQKKKKKEIFIEEVVVTFHTRAIKSQKPNIGIYDYRTINY